MTSLLTEYYLWLKAFHIIAVMSWMAGMLYLPRLFVYHCQVDPNSEASEKFKVMEKKLLKYIINPAMVVSIAFGCLLIIPSGAWGTGWFYSKLLCILLLTGTHGMMSRYRKDFEKGQNTKSERYYRIFNEVPTILMIAIVILAVTKIF